MKLIFIHEEYFRRNYVESQQMMTVFFQVLTWVFKYLPHFPFKIIAQEKFPRAFLFHHFSRGART